MTNAKEDATEKCLRTSALDHNGRIGKY